MTSLSVQCERALDLLTRLAAAMGPACWDYHSGHEDFNAVMAKFCGDFASSSDVDKFALCDTIRTVIRDPIQSSSKKYSENRSEKCLFRTPYVK